MAKTIRNPRPLHLGNMVKGIILEFQQHPVNVNKLHIDLFYSKTLPITYLDELLVKTSLESIILLSCVTARPSSRLQIDIQAVPNEIHVRMMQLTPARPITIANPQQIDSKLHPQTQEIHSVLLKQACQLAAYSGGNLLSSINENHDTTFVYSLPILSITDNLINEMPANYLRKKYHSFPFDTPQTKSKILIIDECYDQSGKLYHTLIPEFEVFVARGAKEGIEKTIKYMPNIIIIGQIESALEPDYIFKFITEDSKAGHIPIIKLQPSNLPIPLNAPINAHFIGSKEMTEGTLINLIKTILKLSEQIKRRLLEHLGRQGRVSFQENIEHLLRVDENEFIINTRRLIEKHHMEESLNVERLAELSFMSKSRFQRKIIALAGETASSMIRTFRLRKARHLLISMPEHSIHTISANCGFSDPNYFSTVFSREYGIAPIRYRQQVLFNRSLNR
ncbi:MAG: helix-turn-helix transcriptional regulator [Chitinophagales bacterium]|jgi:AraC-like DNA-binding protein